jgi:TolB-like protein
LLAGNDDTTTPRARLISGLHFPHRRLILAFYRRWSQQSLEGVSGDRSLRYVFEDCTFDTERREMHRGEAPVSVAPQVFDLLEYLIRNRDRVVTRDELIGAVWSGRIISDEALTTRLNVARSAIGDTGHQQRLIKTLHRKGFRFVGDVQEASEGAVSSGVPAATIPDRPSIAVTAPRLSMAVLPFTNIGGDSEQEYFVDGVTESLTTDLSRIGGLFVIARNSAFSYKNKLVDVRQIGRELNVRYILEGAVQRGGNQLRVNVQLIDAETAHHLWAERFDKPVGDLFDMQDEIVSRLAHSLNAALIKAEALRSLRSPRPDAMDLCFQGMACLNKGTTLEYLTQARSFFDRALALDPNNIDALVGGARVDVVIGSSFLTDDRTPHLAAAEAVLTKVLSMAPGHAFAHLNLGFVQIFTDRAERGIAECERALALDRNLAEAHAWIGLANHVVGRSARTEAHINEALRLSPRDSSAYRWMVAVGFSKLQLKANAEATAWFRRSIEANRNHPFAHFALAAALAQLCSLDEARAAVQAGLALHPDFTIRRFRASAWSNSPGFLAGRERIYEGMRLAGVPEGSAGQGQ